MTPCWLGSYAMSRSTEELPMWIGMWSVPILPKCCSVNDGEIIRAIWKRCPHLILRCHRLGRRIGAKAVPPWWMSSRTGWRPSPWVNATWPCETASSAVHVYRTMLLGLVQEPNRLRSTQRISPENKDRRQSQSQSQSQFNAYYDNKITH